MFYNLSRADGSKDEKTAVRHVYHDYSMDSVSRTEAQFSRWESIIKQWRKCQVFRDLNINYLKWKKLAYFQKRLIDKLEEEIMQIHCGITLDRSNHRDSLQVGTFYKSTVQEEVCSVGDGRDYRSYEHQG